MFRPPLCNLKTRAQAAFRFTYSDSFDLAIESNETAARDCDPVCVCNVKAAWLCWADCDCDDCRVRRGDL